ncbi:protein phosphatase [Stackebrandtia albiflava]|uniref:Serine/threonine protein phosphatase PstP n=1 Tax=Stackebrandtia albiflava TaxID=406432 RepID=A0A562V106_9ACTN|nr:PP2C family serine/threonine-protein phosphatase [Stackebrandtia albiflava]TWJ11525.1 protein phosphatase [Stackebrandtia albiflava]
MTLTLRYAAVSDRGLIRSGNQDSVYAGPRLIAVADGMGGMAAGDLASNIVISSLSVLDEDVPRGDLTAALAGAVEEANHRIRTTVEENPQMEGMGTTLTAFLFSGSTLGMVHIGDSRAYRLRGGALNQITKDDTYVQMLVDEGQLSPDEAENHPQRSLLLRALGSNEVEPTFASLEAVAGDRYLLCSDGLSGVVSDETIAEVLRQIPDPREAVDRLVQLALRGGGPDNVTVLVADVTDADIIEAAPIVGGAAAADRDDVSAADPSTAAARAAATTAGPAEPEAETHTDDAAAEPPRKRRGKAGWYTLVALLLVGIVVSAGYLVYQSQYFVGVDDEGHVAVFQGFNGEVLGVSLATVEVASERSVDDLTPDARRKVTAGIPADSREEALEILQGMTDDDPDNANLLDPCPSPSPSPLPEPSGDPDSSESASDDADPSPSDSPSPDGTTTSGPEPGVDCRPID